MNRLKFVKFTGAVAVENVVVCDHYEARTNDCHIVLTTFKTHTDENGVERMVGTGEDHFDACYVENETGKTVAVYSMRKGGK